MRSSVTLGCGVLLFWTFSKVGTSHTSTHTSSDLLFSSILLLSVIATLLFCYFVLKIKGDDEMVARSKAVYGAEHKRECSPYVAGWPWKEDTCGTFGGSPCMCEICIAGHEILMTHGSATPEEKSCLFQYLTGNGTNPVLASLATANLVDETTGMLCECERCVDVRVRAESMSSFDWVHPNSQMVAPSPEGVIGEEFEGSVLLELAGGPEEFKKAWVERCLPGGSTFCTIGNANLNHVYYFECDRSGYHDRFARHVGVDTDPQVRDLMKSVSLGSSGDSVN